MREKTIYGTPAWVNTVLYPFTPKTFMTPEGAMSYLDEGTAVENQPVYLFLHGTPSWSYEYGDVIFALRHKFRCIAPDMIGFGLSNKPVDFDYNLSTLAGHIYSLIEKLDLKNIRLVASDFGGPIGLTVALRNPALFSKIYLCNTWAWPLEFVDSKFAFTKYLASSPLMKYLYLRWNFSATQIVKQAWGRHKPLTPEEHWMYQAVFKDKEKRMATWKFAQHICNAGNPMWKIGKQLDPLKKIPMHFFWGFQDKFINFKHYEEWRRRYPLATRTKFELVGHFVCHEAAEEVIDILSKK